MAVLSSPTLLSRQYSCLSSPIIVSIRLSLISGVRGEFPRCERQISATSHSRT